MLIGIFFFLFIFIVTTNVLLYYKNFSIVSQILGFILYLVIIGFVTYNNDWNAYEDRYLGYSNTIDLLYFFFYKIFNYFNCSFKSFYLANQILNGFLLLLFINKTKNKNHAVIVVTVTLILVGATMSILLRYATSFLFFINGVYYYTFSKKKFKGIVFLFLSVTAHFGGIILIVLFFGLRFFKNYLLKPKYIILVGLGLVLLKSFIFFILSKISGGFLFYIEESSSSIQGGLLASLPVIFWFLSIVVIDKYLLKKEKKDELYFFLYGLSLMPFILFFLGLTLQIVLYRYIEPFIIIWGCYIGYVFKYFQRKPRFHLLLGVALLSMLTIYLKYYLPFEIIGISEWYKHYEELLESNRLNIFK
ncbi:EpsG family protein [Elizabethkingia meningoseptica]|uniref:EpsG family protein n=1 Tax=Elizabethkingia meningoseptica TaxID=238 RepID=UPI002DD62B61|nr:EpsG family protein [Elizabethkingia meningoseptica]MEC4712249.1 EpsG family protein [Elizabethkingia meningoseptica]